MTNKIFPPLVETVFSRSSLLVLWIGYGESYKGTTEALTTWWPAASSSSAPTSCLVGIIVSIWVRMGHNKDPSIILIPHQDSVLVFGSYSSWTYDKLDLASPAYFIKSPFMCAFMLLILQWVSAPLLICLMCWTLCMEGALLWLDWRSSTEEAAIAEIVKS